MKKLIFLISLFIVFSYQKNYGQDYLESDTSIVQDAVTPSDGSWSNITSVTINVDVDGDESLNTTKRVLVTAGMNMKPSGSSTDTRQVNYRIINDETGEESGIISREIYNSTEGDTWGIGTLVHIFDFDVATTTGEITFTIQHSNSLFSATRNVSSNVQLTAVALTSEINGNELSSDVKRITAGVTIPTTYSPVTGLTTTPISLPSEGDIYVSASINSTGVFSLISGNDRIAEYKLEYSSNGGPWTDLGTPVKRNLYIAGFILGGIDDFGIISLVGVLPNQDAGSTHEFRVSHKVEGGFAEFFETQNSNIVAVGLAHDEGRFPAFLKVENTQSITETTPSPPPASTAMVTETGIINTRPAISGVGPKLFVNTQFLMSASNMNSGIPERMIASNQLFLDGPTPDSALKFNRFLGSNGRFGSGGYIGLTNNLSPGASYIVRMQQGIENIINSDNSGDVELTTSNVILAGFQTYDIPSSSLGILDNELTKKLQIYTTYNTVEIRNENPINAEVYIYNVLGQKIKSSSLINEKSKSIYINHQKGILIVTIKINGEYLSKKVILN